MKHHSEEVMDALPGNQVRCQTDASRLIPYRWVLTIFLFLIATLFYSDRTAYATLFPLLRGDLGFSELWLGAISAFYLWSFALVSPFAGYWGDRIPRRALVIFSILCWSLITVASSLVSSANQLLALRIALGATECVFVPNAIALLGEYHGARTRGTAMALFVAGINLGLVCGGTFSGFLGESYGWRPAIQLLGGSGLLFLALGYFILVKHAVPPEELATASEVRAPLWGTLAEIMRVPTFWILAIDGIVLNFGAWIFLNWLPLYFQESFGLGLTASGFSATAYMTAGVILGILFGGALSDWIVKYGLHQRLSLETVLIFFSAPFPLLFLIQGKYGVIAFSIFAFNFFRSMGQANSSPITCEVLKRGTWSTCFGFMNMVNSLAAGGGVVLAGYLKSSMGLKEIFAAVSLIVFLAALVLVYGYLRYIRQDLLRAGQEPAAEVPPALSASQLGSDPERP
ncbi:MAG: MFS transporter [Terriglobia bacterium]